MDEILEAIKLVLKTLLYDDRDIIKYTTKLLGKIYTSLIDAGFSNDQSFDILMKMISSFSLPKNE